MHTTRPASGLDLAMTTWLPRERTCAKPRRSNAAMAPLPETLGSFGIRRVDGERRQDRERRRWLLLFLEVEPGRLKVGDRFLERLALAHGAELGHSAT
jgi:hypothetical protein